MFACYLPTGLRFSFLAIPCRPMLGGKKKVVPFYRPLFQFHPSEVESLPPAQKSAAAELRAEYRFVREVLSSVLKWAEIEAEFITLGKQIVQGSFLCFCYQLQMLLKC